MNPKERKKVRDRFFAMLGGIDDQAISGMLNNVTSRQVSRWRAGENIPGEAVAERMQEHLETAEAGLLLDDDAKFKAAERVRREREAEQLKHPHIELEDGTKKEIPLFYKQIRDLIHQGEYRQAYNVGLSRIETKTDWEQIPEDTKPYVAGSFGLALYYMGETLKARDYYNKALNLCRSGGKNYIPPTFLAAYENNLALTYMRTREFDLAYQHYESAALISPSSGYVFYNALCCASRDRDEAKLSEWCGRVKEALVHHFSDEDIKIVLDGHETDNDLEWARSCEIFREVVAALKHRLTNQVNTKGEPQ